MALEFSSDPRHPTDKIVTYTFLDNSEAAYIKARHSIGAACPMLDRSDSIIAGNLYRRITFQLVKREQVTLERVDLGIKHRCTCSEHRRRAPCGVRVLLILPVYTD